MTEPSKVHPRLNFGNLPLVEAAVRVSFESPVELTFDTINQLHAYLRDDFPTIAEPVQIEPPPGVKTSRIEFGPGRIPGVVYTGNSCGIVIGIQSQLAVVRWVKQAPRESPVYPRFAALRDMLWRVIDQHFGPSNGQSTPIVVNMSYVNFIRVGDSGSVLSDYFSELVQIAATKGAQQVHNVTASWQERDSIDLRYSLDQVEAGEDGLEGFRVTTAAGLRLPRPGEARLGLERIHDRLQSFFLSLISERAQEEWQLAKPLWKPKEQGDG